MTLGEELQKAFSVKAKKTIQESVRRAAQAAKNGKRPKVDYEVALFEALRASMNGMRHYPAISSQLHGTTRAVEFPIPNPKSPNCELGDLGIVAFSKTEMRVVVMQNKFTKKEDSVSYISPYNLRQYDLLRNRPLFRFVGEKRTCDLLSASPLTEASVCVYGNFYPTANNPCGYDMSCITANQLVKKSQSSLTFNGGFHPAVPVTGDFIATQNLRDFGDYLQRLAIGRNIPDMDTRRDIFRDLRIAFGRFTSGFHTYSGHGENDGYFHQKNFSPKDMGAEMMKILDFTQSELFKSVHEFNWRIDKIRYELRSIDQRYPLLRQSKAWRDWQNEVQTRSQKIADFLYSFEPLLHEIRSEVETFVQSYSVWKAFAEVCGVERDGDESGGGWRGDGNRYDGSGGGNGGGRDGSGDGDGGGRDGSGDGNGGGGYGYGRALLEGCRSVVLLDVSEHPSDE